MEKKYIKNLFIVLLVFVIIVLADTIWKKNQEIKEKQTSIDDLNIQINSLWENVQQLQEEYSKIVDKLYSPDFTIEYLSGLEVTVKPLYVLISSAPFIP